MKKEGRNKSRRLLAEGGRESAPEIAVKIAPFGITPDRVAVLRQGVLNHKAVAKYLGKARKRLLSFEVLDRLEGDTKRPLPQGPNRFRATFFDYTHNRTVVA